MNIKTQSFLILGVSKSGYNAGKYILSNNGTCYIYEDLITSKTEIAINELIALGAVRLDSKVEDSTLSKIDVLVISPGVPINHSISVRMKNLGKKIIGELEFGFLQFLPLTVAVTGTNGKTTTVSLIA